jgi:hypothetical protein
MRFYFSLSVLALSIALHCVPAEAAELTAEQVNGAKVGMDYKEVRARLTELGFAPDSPSKDMKRCGSRKTICKKYPEVEACAGTGAAPCRFAFKYPRGRKIVVITRGEDLRVTDIFEK